MSVQTEIDRIITAVHAAHEKVKEKGGTTSEPYLVANLEGAIGSIPEASDPTLQSKTVSPDTSQQVVTPDSGYDGLSKVTVNAMPTATQATPSISVNSSGLITASATQSAGYVSAGTKSATKQLTTQAAQTITPSTSDKTIASGRYLTGTQTIKGDSNLKAENIKSGVSIFGVAGSYEGSGGGGSETEMQTVTGSIVPSDTDWGTTAGTEVFSVSGLPFTPKILVIYPTGKMSVTYKNTALFFGYTYIKDVQDKMTVASVGNSTSNSSVVGVQYLDNDNQFFNLTVNSDGFTLTTSGASVYTRRTRGNYTYIAMA